MKDALVEAVAEAVRVHCHAMTYPKDAARAALEAQAQQAVALAEALQLIRYGLSGPLYAEVRRCRGCGHDEDEGCADTCAVAKALADYDAAKSEGSR